MWFLKPTEEFEKQFAWYEKKHPRELAAVARNLTSYVRALDLEVKPQQMTFAFIHREPHGVVAIDQSGGGRNLKETRLYVYPNAKAKCLFQLTIGDKKSQNGDIAFCSRFVTEWNEDHTHEGEAEDDERTKDENDETGQGRSL